MKRAPFVGLLIQAELADSSCVYERLWHDCSKSKNKEIGGEKNGLNISIADL